MRGVSRASGTEKREINLIKAYIQSIDKPQTALSYKVSNQASQNQFQRLSTTECNQSRYYPEDKFENCSIHGHNDFIQPKINYLQNKMQDSLELLQRKRIDFSDTEINIFNSQLVYEPFDPIQKLKKLKEFYQIQVPKTKSRQRRNIIKVDQINEVQILKQGQSTPLLGNSPIHLKKPFNINTSQEIIVLPFNKKQKINSNEISDINREDKTYQEVNPIIEIEKSENDMTNEIKPYLKLYMKRIFQQRKQSIDYRDNEVRSPLFTMSPKLNQRAKAYKQKLNLRLKRNSVVQFKDNFLQNILIKGQKQEQNRITRSIILLNDTKQKYVLEKQNMNQNKTYKDQSQFSQSPDKQKQGCSPNRQSDGKKQKQYQNIQNLQIGKYDFYQQMKFREKYNNLINFSLDSDLNKISDRISSMSSKRIKHNEIQAQIKKQENDDMLNIEIQGCQLKKRSKLLMKQDRSVKFNI